MKIAVEQQVGSVTDHARARIAMVRPILTATLYALKGERIARLGGLAKVTVEDLAREYIEGSGDCGICFEYAVHEAITQGDANIQPRISTVLEEFCNIPGGAQSILFGAEKKKSIGLIQTAAGLLTDDSRILVGKIGQPPKLKRYLQKLVKAFNNAADRERLPPSIRGVWRCDLFVGSATHDQWVATTLKINAQQLEGDAGIRVGLYPERYKGESPSQDNEKNLILCPLPYDGGFMELFYSSFFLVKQFLNTRTAQVPSPVHLPNSADRLVASLLEERRKFPVQEVVEALAALAQPDLLTSKIVGSDVPDVQTTGIAPVAKVI